MNGTSTARVKVEGGGTGVVSHVGLHALGAFADRLGLGHVLSEAIPQRPTLVHDRGTVLTQAMLVLAGGGESCADIELLRCEETLFRSVCSDSTLNRAVHEITPEVRAEMAASLAQVRAEVWRRSSEASSRPVLLDIDSTLVEIHSEGKEKAAPTYKGGYGFHPILCFSDATGEALSGILRPGNAGANTAADHVTVLDDAICQLPDDVQAGHRKGDDPDLASCQVTCRTDSAGTTKAFLSALRERNVTFMTSATSNAEVQGAIMDAIGIEQVWTPAITTEGTEREDAAVCELTSLVDLSGFPGGTRLIVRREPLHPGAQRSLFPSLEYRYWGFYTDLPGKICDLDLMMRQHAHVEQHIERLKDSGLLRFPFSDFEANATWMSLVMMAADLVRWFQLLCFDGSWRSARPKALRWRLFHAPGRVVRAARQTVVRILADWPEAEVLLGVYRHIAALT